MALNLERYEILKKHLPEEAARVIAEAFPAADQLVTRDYLDARLGELRVEMHHGFAEVNSRMLTMMVSLMATQLLGIAGIIVAILLK